MRPDEPDEPMLAIRSGLSRRRFLVGAATVAGAGVAAGSIKLATQQASGRTPAEHGLLPYRMAMHVHASASEGPGSMEAQLTQAARIGVDVLWWTEHDQRMCAHGAPTSLSFSGITEQQPKANTAIWTWTPSTTGSATTTTNHFVAGGQSKDILNDRANALLLGVDAGVGAASHQLSGIADNELSRTSLAGMTISLDVYPTVISGSAFLSIELVTSYRPASVGRPAGSYKLSYRIGGGRQPGISTLVAPTLATVTLAAPKNTWTTVVIHPDQDLASLWPGVDGRDSSLYQLSVCATAADHGSAEGYLGNLVFDRAQIAGQDPLAIQQSLSAHYAPRFPSVKQIQALELSLGTPHVGWYGETVAIPDLTNQPAITATDPGYAGSLVKQVHAAKGLASYCHPYGTSSTLSAPADQDKATAALSSALIANRALGCDLLEVGYRARGGCDLAHHEKLWDNLSRNAVFITGTGVNDDHVGSDWLGAKLNFTSSAWAADSSVRSLLDAMKRGRLFFSDPARFQGRLDILLGGRSAMGAVSVSTSSHRSIAVLATGVPADGSVVMLRGTVDLAGASHTEPEIVRTTIRADNFDGDGEVSIDVNTTKSRFVRFVIYDGNGLEVGFTNPIWLLRSKLSGRIPADRLI